MYKIALLSVLFSLSLSVFPPSAGRRISSANIYFMTPSGSYFESGKENKCDFVDCPIQSSTGNFCKVCNVTSENPIRIGNESDNVPVWTVMSFLPFNVSFPVDMWTFRAGSHYTTRVYRIKNEYLAITDSRVHGPGSSNLLDLEILLGYSF